MARRLRPPVQRVALCKRELLLRSLNVARSGKLSVLYGPAGYGKTTVLAQWRDLLHDQGLHVAWLTAAHEDGEPQAFMKALMYAVRTAQIDLGEADLWLSGDVPAIRRMEATILALERCETPCVIMIDTFETINKPIMSTILAELIDLLPDHVHLVLASRRKPQLGLSTHLARGNVRMFGPDELRFDAEELAQAWGLPLTSIDLALLDRTEGWPIAVQLHRLWRENAKPGRADISAGLPTAELTQYMTDEVFRTLGHDHQELLSDLSILSDIETHLADHVRQADDSAALLEEISETLPGLIERCRTGLETTYRLHPLIADHARQRLKLRAGREPRLRCQAARWFWDHKRYSEALGQAVLSHDAELLEGLTASLPTLEIFLARGSDELRAILRTLPSGALHQSSRVRLAEALTLSKAGHFKDAWRIVEALAADGSGTSDPDYQVEYLMIQSIIASHFMTARSAADLALDQISELAASAPMVRAFVDNGWVVMHQQGGDLEAAKRALARAHCAYDSGGDFPFSHFHLRAHALQIALAQGQLGLASELSHAMFDDDRTSLTAHVRLATARIALSSIDYSRTYRLRAADHARMALALLGEGDATFDQYAIAIPIILNGTMRRDGAAAALGEMSAIADRFSERGLISMDDVLRSLDLLYRVRSGSGPSQIDPQDLRRAQHPRVGVPWRERDGARHAVALHAMADRSPELALFIANAMLEDGRNGNRLETQVRALILGGLAQEMMDDHSATDRSLTEALRLASPEALLSPFAEEGHAIRPALVRLAGNLQSSRSAQHLEKILHTLSSQSHPGQLTDREAEILAHLADGASNKLIARRLELTENTVKFHMKNIFAKLGVTSRKEAAACAFRDS